jgi:hypothetical protein
MWFHKLRKNFFLKRKVLDEGGGGKGGGGGLGYWNRENLLLSHLVAPPLSLATPTLLRHSQGLRIMFI